MVFWHRPTLLCTALVLKLAVSGAAPAEAQTLGDAVRAGQQVAHGRVSFLPRLGLARGNAVFGTTEFESPSLGGLPQWTRVLADVARERARFQACVESVSECTTPTLRNWNRIIRTAAPLDRAGKIRVVNEFFNRWPYKEDQELYGRSEYWATPSEFMARSGDCEDYSIVKYFALRALGFSQNEMRIVILMDEIRGIGHAVLAIYEKDEILILDSLSNLILPHDRYKHYRPQYSMNESTRWAHIGGYKREPTVPYKGLAARQN